MLDSVHCRSALHANAHPAERAPQLSMHRPATGLTRHNDRGGNTRLFGHAYLRLIHGDEETVARHIPLTQKLENTAARFLDRSA
jgi:hypothetical protein